MTDPEPDPSPAENVLFVAGHVSISQHLLDDAHPPDFDRYIMGTLARDYGLEIDRETAELLDRIDWRPQPFKRTWRDRLRQRIGTARTALAYRIAPWLPREDDW